jgi:tetratricopeptide (TPR) repeat protein
MSDSPTPARSPPLWKLWIFRALAVLLGLSPLIIVETGLRIAGIGKATDSNDPFVGFSSIQPLFVRNDECERYEIAPSRFTHFQPDSFTIAKPRNEFRIFVLGGSTVQGRPWSIETAFSTWLELSLNAADASRRYEVVNCGGVSYSSYRLAPILQEVLHYEPDLIIFCEGNNEFLEDRTYAPLREQPALLFWVEQQAHHLRTYNLLRGAVLACCSCPNQPAQLGLEVDARLDWQDGMQEYHRDPDWQRNVIRHFEFNLRRFVAITREANVPLLFVMPVSNLQWAPFKSEHRADLSTAELAEYDALRQEAAKLLPHDHTSAIAKLQEAVALDHEFADGQYELGLALLEAGRRNEAEQALRRAKELDVCPLRILQPMQESLHRVAAETGTPLVDADALFAALSRNGFPDNQWLIDHCHPTIEGNQRLADAIADELIRQNFLKPAADWQAKKEAAYREHFAGLSHAYFARGRDRLKAEQGWARGQVKKQRQEEP